MNYKQALGIKSSIRLLIAFIVVYLHFLGKEPETFIWGNWTVQRSSLEALLLWFIAGLLLVNNWLDITNQEVHYKYRELKKELDRQKGIQ